MLTKKKLCIVIQVFLGIILIFVIKNNSYHFKHSNKTSTPDSNDKLPEYLPYKHFKAPLLAAPIPSKAPEIPDSIEDIKELIKIHNKKQIILNDDKFEPLKADATVVVVQVHKRLEYLRHLIKSLSNASQISQILLIFSHDFYDSEINKLIQSITFCRVLQIFYPYSIQLHPNEFPGSAPDDCPRDINQTVAKEIKCKGTPDLFGHYREAKYVQIKHHWWWKANIVFDNLESTKHLNGHFLFLEEDHFVAPDFIYMLKLLQNKTIESCQKCNILVLGKYKVEPSDSTYANNDVYIREWTSSLHNMGMAFKRTIWEDMRNCTTSFCTYDDYNWDWSLQYIGTKCMERKLNAMSLAAPRVFHIGQCGTHTVSKMKCNADEMISKIQETFNYATKASQFNPKILAVGYDVVPLFILRHNGGWGDLRDHNLCINSAKSFS